MKLPIATIATAAAVLALAANGIYGAVKGPDTKGTPDYATAAKIQAGYGPGGPPPQLAAQVAAHTGSHEYAAPELIQQGYGPAGAH